MNPFQLGDDYNLNEVNRFITKYELKKTIHAGRKNAVAIAYRKKNLNLVCVKAVSNPYYCKLKETKYLKQLRNTTGIIYYYEYFHVKPTVHLLVTEYFGNMNLKHYLKKNGPLSEKQCHTIMKQLISIVNQCTRSRIFHRNIKLSHIRINEKTLKIKLINFSLACHLHSGYYFDKLHPCIAPPEWFKYEHYKADGANVWSLGIILYQLLLNRLPFESPFSTAFFKCDIFKENHLSLDVKILINWMFTKSPSKRITIKLMQYHPWVLNQWI
jgi:serine/threonine protein kinase